MYLHQVAGALAADRRENPGDDLISALVHAEVDGDRLTDFEVSAFFVLLSVAGNDTTRQTMSHAIKALTEFRDQRAWLMDDFDDRIGSAIEEFVRWATPVMTFRRTAATDCMLGDQAIAAGEKVVMFYSSGNYDDTVFDAPERFDLGRKPNPHLGFGGGGPHFCLGAHVGRAQLRAMFGELLVAAAGHRGRRARLRPRQLHPRHPLAARHLLVISACSPALSAGEHAEITGAVSSSDSSASNSEQPPSTLTVARASPRVGPRLMMATGLPAAAACRTNRSPENTVSDEPATSSASAPSTSE